MTNTDGLNKISTLDALNEMIANDIYSMTFEPGSRITEKTLTERYNVSRNTIREAIVVLLANGLLIRVPNKGVYVRSLNIDDVNEIFELRYILEAEALKYIIESGIIPADLFKLAKEINALTDKEDWEQHISADIRFHEKLIEASGSARLARLYWDIVYEIKLCMYQSKRYLPYRNENSFAHMELLSALENDNLNGALNILKNHFTQAIAGFEIAFAKKDNS